MSTQPTPSDNEQSYSCLMRGLKELVLQGPAVPSNLVLIGDHAFPLAMNSQGQVLMAASLYGRGRIVVLGHESYMSAFPALVENALTWLRGSGSDNLLVGVHQKSRAVADNLSKSSFQAKVVEGFHENLGVGVYVTNTDMVGPDVKSLVGYLKAGGGVLIAGQAWAWAGLNPEGNVLLDFPGNKVSSVAGIYFTACKGTVESLPVCPQIPWSRLAIDIGRDFKDDLEFLLKGVSELDIQGDGLPCEVLAHGHLAFPIGATPEGQAFLAGAYYGQGRVIVATHESFLKLQALAPFMQNALHWLDKGRKGVIGVLPELGKAFSMFSQSGLSCEKTNFRKDLSVYVCKSYSDEHAEEIQNFVAEGGGLLIGGQAWHWAHTHPCNNVLTEYPGNHILNKMGLSLLGNYLYNGCYKARVPGQAGYYFRHMLQSFTGHVTQGEELSKQEEACLEKLGRDCANYLQMKANDWSSYEQVLSPLTDMLKENGIPQVCPSCPVQKPKDHLLLIMGTEVYKVCPDRDALLPYLIKDNPVMPVVHNHRVKINANTAREEEWISTGLYLSPGMKTNITMPPEIVNKGWTVQIGCQTDNLEKKEELKRAPSVHDRFHVTTEMMQVWNLWGGLIYLVAPSKTQVEGAEVIVQTAILAPYYKSGVTTLAEWSSLRTAPSPWAELEFENIILTVPSDVVRGLDRPDEVAAFWDDNMRGIADLAAIPSKFPRKERFVTDVQISFGWMHSGYPIMMHTASAKDLVDPEKARRTGIWGPIHELGHNQQRGCWEFRPNTLECTCNLWSVYVHEEVLGINMAKVENAMRLEARKKRAEDYVKGGRNLASWSMFVALETYMQLQDQFGWEAFKKVFAAYHDMTNFPHDNKGKMNLYAETFSQAVEKNLSDFFKAWGWPIEPATEDKLSSLPEWHDHPMVQYG